MNLIPLDDVLMSLCSRSGKTGLDDPTQSYYTTVLDHAHMWLKNWVNGMAIGAREVLTVENQRVYIPAGLTIGNVGISVDGTFAPLLPNENMLAPEPCGEFEPPDTGNPDYIAYVSTADASTYMAGYGVALRPGLGGGRSLHGYYRIFDREGYIAFDSISDNTEIILEGTYPAFVPGKLTFINALAEEAITTYCKWQVTGDREDHLLYNMKWREWQTARGSEPACALFAAANSGYGKAMV